MCNLGMDTPHTCMQLPMNMQMNKYGASLQRVTATKGKQVKTEQKENLTMQCVEIIMNI